MRLIDADALIKEITEFRCVNCDRRKGMKKGKMTFVYEIGDVPCRACDVMDMIDVLDEAPTVAMSENSITLTWTPDADDWVKEVAERALDEFEYKGRTIRAWVELIMGLPEPPEEVAEHDPDDF